MTYGNFLQIKNVKEIRIYIWYLARFPLSYPNHIHDLPHSLPVAIWLSFSSSVQSGHRATTELGHRTPPHLHLNPSDPHFPSIAYHPHSHRTSSDNQKQKRPNHKTVFHIPLCFFYRRITTKKKSWLLF